MHFTAGNLDIALAVRRKSILPPTGEAGLHPTRVIATGGVIVLCGNSGMAQNFGSSSTQGSILVNYNSSSTATVTLSDSDGNTIVTYNPPKTYNSVVISAPALTKGNTYSLTACGQTQIITLSSLIYGSGGMGGGTTQPGGRPGGRP